MALVKVRYLKDGRIKTIPRTFASTLLRLGLVELVTDQPKPKRQYKRRDMVAEQHTDPNPRDAR
jgi:hypothetical protein